MGNGHLYGGGMSSYLLVKWWGNAREKSLVFIQVRLDLTQTLVRGSKTVFRLGQ